MTEREALKLALEALEESHPEAYRHTITAIKEVLAQPEQEPSFWMDSLDIEHRTPTIITNEDKREGHLSDWRCIHPVYTTPPQPQPEQEPVAWLITDENINSIQIASIQRLIDRARHAHMADLKLRINGEDEWYELDWLKHLTRATPPQRTWVWLTDEEIGAILEDPTIAEKHQGNWLVLPYSYARAVEAKLKEKNT